MPIDTSSPIDQLATSSQAMTRHFCRLGIDVHAQGHLTLAEACGARGLVPEKVAQDLAALKPPVQRDWSQATTPELVHHIVHHHHAFTREELVRIQKLMDAGLAIPGPAQAMLIRLKVHFASLARDLVAHFQMEERNLFPAICAAENGSMTPISLSTPSEQARTISAEHQAAEELLHNIRLITADYEIAPGIEEHLRIIYLGLRNLEDDLHLHLFLENHILFPRALPA
ncbi:hemerythrin domain-containing protein [Mesoterricola silvestris]|uniref:Iron-sulfur cluster repair protein YtfE n=1 Tax=Mesoterricola silvestris TaxID=2927979 RepID=A0AA48KAT6_9BACT|nr:hemerythrin domain-containing protein [Mesoterricola silvestris]BDU73642.1 iron-sulfur cluster repair protein YtfE [Mesoterricola silvestris]